MNPFQLYFQLGISHITDIQGYDHILFLITLCAVYCLNQWKSILVLITAFTIGHCTTLVLATFNIIHISSDLIEFLIPVTILITAIANMVQKDNFKTKTLHLIKYIAALFFGLIHGLGFSNYLKSLLGMESSIIKPLLAFNIGIELGQIFVVLVILGITALITNVLSFNKREWSMILSGAGAGVSLILIIERFPF
jgi:HupE/UreJ protein